GTGYYRGEPFWGCVGKIGRTVMSSAGLGGGGGVKAKALPGMIQQGVSAALTKMRALPSGLKVAGAGAGIAAAAGAGHMLMGHPAMAGGVRGMQMCKAHKGVAPHLGRNRRMQVTNPKATRRATRRRTGFAQ